MLTKKEMIILQELRGDARKTLTGISRKTNIPLSTVLLTLRKLENTVIKKYVSLLNYPALGYNIKVHLFLKPKEGYKKKLKNFLLSHNSVNTFYKINGDYDFLVECIFRKIEELEGFKERLEEMSDSRQEHHILENIKNERFCQFSVFPKDIF
jgi:DNA-binding Lrp family transcriptional regulator